MSNNQEIYGASSDDQLSALLRDSVVVYEETDLSNRVLCAAKTKKATGVSTAASLNVIDRLMVELRNQIEKNSITYGEYSTGNEPLHDEINFKIQLLQRVRRHRLVEKSKSTTTPTINDPISNLFDSVGPSDTSCVQVIAANDSQLRVNPKTMIVDWSRHSHTKETDIDSSEEDFHGQILDTDAPEEYNNLNEVARSLLRKKKRSSDNQSFVRKDKDDDVLPSDAKSSGKRISKAQHDSLLVVDDWNDETYNARMELFCAIESKEAETIESLCKEAIDEAVKHVDAEDIVHLQEIEDTTRARVQAQFRPHALSNGLLVPLYIWNQLLPYQQSGLGWFWEHYRSNTGGILGDEMGLGKTVQIAGYLGALEYNRLLRPSLIVCPATVIAHWIRELTTWWPPLRVYALHESGGAMRSGLKARHALERILSRMMEHKGIMLITYEGLRIHCDALLRFRWGHIILDEGHKIRNPESGISISAKSLASTHRIILSGTPIQNHLRELWSLFDFIMPGRLGTLPTFEAQFSNPIAAGGWSHASPVQIATAYECSVALKDLISPFLLRRLKKDVNTQLPKKTEQVLFCKLSPVQRSLYSQYLQSEEVGRVLDGKQQAFRSINLLRNLCNHAAVFNPKEKENAKWNVRNLNLTMETLVGNSGKMIVLSQILKMWQTNGNRCLIFTQGRRMLDLLEIYCKAKGYRYLRMDGSTTVRERQVLIDSFNGDSKWFAFLATTRTGGIGVNLTGADRVVLFDPDWNPSTDAQSRERAWRLGQRRPVSVYRLITAGTIEEKVYQRQVYKTALSSKVLSRDMDSRRLFAYSDLRDLFHLGDGIETSVPSHSSLSGPEEGFVLDQLIGSTAFSEEDDFSESTSEAAQDPNSRTGVLQSVIDGASASDFLPDAVEGERLLRIGRQIASSAVDALKGGGVSRGKESTHLGVPTQREKYRDQKMPLSSKDASAQSGASSMTYRKAAVEPVTCEMRASVEALLPPNRKTTQASVPSSCATSSSFIGSPSQIPSHPDTSPVAYTNVSLMEGKLRTRIQTGETAQTVDFETLDPVLEKFVPRAAAAFGKFISPGIIETVFHFPAESESTFIPYHSFTQEKAGIGYPNSMTGTRKFGFPVAFHEPHVVNPFRLVFHDSIYNTPAEDSRSPENQRQIPQLSGLPTFSRTNTNNKPNKVSGTLWRLFSQKQFTPRALQSNEQRKSNFSLIVRELNPLSSNILQQVQQEMHVQAMNGLPSDTVDHLSSHVKHSSMVLASLRKRVQSAMENS